MHNRSFVGHRMILWVYFVVIYYARRRFGVLYLDFGHNNLKSLIIIYIHVILILPIPMKRDNYFLLGSRCNF